jgi:eukaryotic-like serine/threonine-protein kinase
VTLAQGTRLGHYEIVGTIGAGGMGEVYRARDTKLGRDVAIKTILDSFVLDRERLARFEREARALAALNHPNVATLYGMEQADGQHLLVMELVDGPTLKEVIDTATGLVPDTSEARQAGLDVSRALRLALQIAEGLEAAHEKGIVHRDLKPANIKVTADDKVKVLDFGLATSGRGDSSDSSMSLANSPTLTAMGTQAGMILGTASYMSPEQARGVPADHRSDVFSFGIVLYEMLTGRQPFHGDTVSDVLASVLAREPDLSAMPPDVSPRLAELVRRCLDKHPRRRWQAIGDVRHELEVIAANPRKPDESANVVPLAAAASATPRPLWRRAVPVAAAIVATAGLTIAAMTFTRLAPTPAQVSRFVIPYAEGMQLTVRPGIAISPDGSRIAYVSNRRLLVRELGDFTPRPVAATASTTVAPVNPVFSPQGTAVAYYDNVDTSIKQIALAGGSATTVCKAPDMPNGLSWSGDFIYFTNTLGIVRVAAAGGSPELVVKKDPDDVVTRPQVLDDGRLLFSVSQRQTGILDRWANARIVVQRPGEQTPTTVVENGSDPRYLASGHLIYAAGGVLYARRFDPARLTVGAPTPMVEGIFRSSGSVGGGLWWYGVSENGTLVYQPGAVGALGTTNLAIALFDRAGKVETTKIPPGPYGNPRMSPNGKRIAFGVDDGRDVSVWIYEIASGASPRRLTFGGRDRYPAWSSDSQRVIFQSDREGDLGLYAQAADGSGTAVRLTTADKGTEHVPQSVSPDGLILLFDETKDRRTSLKAYSFKDKSISSYANILSTLPTAAVFSPNGRWVAYTMRDEGQSLSTVFVQPYPATGAKYQISPNAEDGHHQVWSRDGKELFYTPGPGTIFTAVSVNTTAPAFSFGSTPAFARMFLNMAPVFERPFDIARNAKGDPVILGLTANTADPSREERVELRIVLNWIEELKARVK